MLPAVVESLVLKFWHDKCPPDPSEKAEVRCRLGPKEWESHRIHYQVMRTKELHKKFIGEWKDVAPVSLSYFYGKKP